MGNGEGEMVNGKSKEQIVFFLPFLALPIYDLRFTVHHFFLKGKNNG